jgi:hypothetical protein
VPLHDTLKGLARFFHEFGGHDQAVGGSLPAARFEEFREAAGAHFRASVPAEKLVRVEEAELELPLEEVTEDLARVLRRFEPHGMGNPRPVFYCAATAFEGGVRSLGDRGVAGGLSRGGAPLPFLSWAPGSLEPLRRVGGDIEIQYRLQRGRSGGIEAEILGARPAGTENSEAASPALAGVVVP